MTLVGCGCGEYTIEIETTKPIYQFGALCPECNNHFGWEADPDT